MTLIWDKTERIKINTLIGSVLNGRLAVVNTECKINGTVVICMREIPYFF